jgi:hypothetical protein
MSSDFTFVVVGVGIRPHVQVTDIYLNTDKLYRRGSWEVSNSYFEVRREVASAQTLRAVCCVRKTVKFER